jgi:hypothetical protein
MASQVHFSLRRCAKSRIEPGSPGGAIPLKSIVRVVLVEQYPAEISGTQKIFERSSEEKF